jgi:gas vesicle protein
MIRALIFLTAGVTLGLLLAPEKGTEMRKKLRGKFDDATKTTKDFLGSGANNTEAGKVLETIA